MFDLHCHLLPGIDDGPDSLDEALALARIAVEDGITHAVVTPHIHPGRWENERTSIQTAVSDFQKSLDDEGIELALGFAGEVRITDLLFTHLEQGKLPFFGEHQGRNALLLEFPHGHLIPGSEKLMKWLLQNNTQPVIAHPERNKEVMRNPEVMDLYADMGCFLQITAGSITGKFGGRAEEIAWRLLEADRVTFVASDAHNAGARPPVLSEASDAVSNRLGATVAKRLFIDMPRALCASQFPDLAKQDNAPVSSA